MCFGFSLCSQGDRGRPGRSGPPGPAGDLGPKVGSDIPRDYINIGHQSCCNVFSYAPFREREEVPDRLEFLAQKEALYVLLFLIMLYSF